MRIRPLVTFSVACFCILPFDSAAPAEPKPNILFIFADDMRADSIAALGNPVVRTPNLDSLVNRGLAFRNAYCMGGNSGAVCTPSRNMLLSGRAYFRWKDYLPPGEPAQRRGLLAPGDPPNFPTSLRQAGYLTYHHGKRGNTAPLIQEQFEINKYLKDDTGDRKDGEPGRNITDEAIEFLRERKDDQPFFMYLAYANPHDPRVAAKTYLDLYDRSRIPLPANFLPQHPFDNGEMVIRDELLAPWPRTDVEIRRHLHEYYAVISGLDFHIGRLLRTLEDLGLSANTIVIFSADQGIAIGSHGLLGKQNLYDHSMKVPLIFAGPRIPHATSEALVYLFDVYPTVCDLTGARTPVGIDGRSFRQVIEGRPAMIRPELFLAYLDLQRAVRDTRWKLIRYPQVNVTQLFDLREDPDETHNLASQEAYAPRVRTMLERLKTLQGEFGDDQELTVPNPKPSRWAPPAGEELDKLLERWKMK